MSILMHAEREYMYAEPIEAKAIQAAWAGQNIAHMRWLLGIDAAKVVAHKAATIDKTAKHPLP